MTSGRIDMYGTDEREAVMTLQAFLHEDLQEPEAEIDDLDVVDGHWQANVVGSQRGIRMVFLREHNGKLAPGVPFPFCLDRSRDGNWVAWVPLKASGG